MTVAVRPCLPPCTADEAAGKIIPLQEDSMLATSGRTPTTNHAPARRPLAAWHTATIALLGLGSLGACSKDAISPAPLARCGAQWEQCWSDRGD